MSTYSSDLRIELITNGAQAGQWGTTTNDTWAYVIDPAITGFQTVAVASASQALTYVSGSTSTASANQAIYASLAFTTSTGANFNVYAPPAPKQYIIWNNSAYSMTLYNSTVIGNTTAAGTGVTITAGSKFQVFSDGTNFYAVDANITSTVPVSKGGTGRTSWTSGTLPYNNGTTSFTPSDIYYNGTNMGLGFAADAWSAGFYVSRIGRTGNIAQSGSTTFGETAIVNGAYYDGTNWIRQYQLAPTLYSSSSGRHLFGYAASSSAGSTFASFTTVATIDSAGVTLATGNFVGNLSGTATTATSATSAAKVTTTNFTIEESGGKLVFKNGSTVIASLSSTGVLTTLSDVVSNTTP